MCCGGYGCVVVVTYVLRWLWMCCDGYGCVAMVTDVLRWLRMCCDGYGSVAMVTDVLITSRNFNRFNYVRDPLSFSVSF